MASYLVVAHQTAASPELIARLRALATTDPDAEFALLVPAKPVGAPLYHNWDVDEVHKASAERGQAAAAKLREAGLKVEAVRVGAPSPVDAVCDELLDRSGYAAIVLSTFPVGISRWLVGNLPKKLTMRTGLPVEHVVAHPEPGSAESPS
jgi:nucleotide-binding universal stress UspA family protein